jgi:hypothetical protein
MSDKKAQIRFEGSDHVDLTRGRTYNLDEIRRSRQPVMPDGEHAWVIDAVYALPDPEVALDSMDLGLDNFIGITQIHCLMCHVPYSTAIRHHKCDQTLR